MNNLKKMICSKHGLPEEAAGYIKGETIEELELSAHNLSGFVERNRGVTPLFEAGTTVAVNSEQEAYRAVFSGLFPEEY